MPSRTDGKAATKWAMVTGASAGIGAEFCQQLAARGYSIVLVARRADRLEDLAAQLRQQHDIEVYCLPLDLSEPGAARRIKDRLDKQNIEIEFLVNNAGYGVPGNLNSVQWSVHEQFLEVMVSVVCELCWVFMPVMQRKGKGFIINVASVAGLVPSAGGHTLYGASKAFLVRFSEALAAEAAADNVRVSALCPGFTYSEFHDVTGTREQVKQLPDYLWLQAEDVVRYGLESVQRSKPRVVAVPGRVYRFLVWIAGAMPGLGRYLANRNAHKFRKT